MRPRNPQIPLFAAALGAEWGLVAEAVRRFHGEAAPAAGATAWSPARAFHGTMTVTWGAAPSARLLCHLLRLPAAGEGVAVALTITPDAGHEHWHRTFGASLFRTRQWLDASGRLAESFGPFALLFELSHAAGGVRYRLSGMRFCGVPLPRALLPRVEAAEAAGPAGQVLVEVGAWVRGAGLVLRYAGVVAAS